MPTPQTAAAAKIKEAIRQLDSILAKLDDEVVADGNTVTCIESLEKTFSLASMTTLYDEDALYDSTKLLGDDALLVKKYCAIESNVRDAQNLLIISLERAIKFIILTATEEAAKATNSKQINDIKKDINNFLIKCVETLNTITPSITIDSDFTIEDFREMWHLSDDLTAFEQTWLKREAKIEQLSSVSFSLGTSTKSIFHHSNVSEPTDLGIGHRPYPS